MRTEEIVKMDLQLFAEPDTESVEDDNPSAPDDEGDQLDLSSLYEEEEDTEGEEAETKTEGEAEQAEEETEEGEEGEGEEESQKDGEQATGQKLFTQEDVNKIVGNARIKGREIESMAKELEQLTGLDINGVVEHVRKSQVQQKADELGLSEEEAQEMVAKDQKLVKMEKEMEDFKRKQEEYNYNQEKGEHLSNPYVKKYEDEIDAFSKNQEGRVVVPFKDAMNYILGKKFAEGEITENIKKGTEKKTLANLKKNQRASPETGSSSGKSDIGGLSKEEKQLAKNMGIDPKEWAKYKG